VTPKPGSTSTATWLRVDGLRIRCLTAGSDGRPVLLLHGGGIDAADFSYKHAIGPLASTRRVFAPDLPGYGWSDGPDGRYTLGFYAGFLGRLMDALGLERASLVGLSLGGGASLGFALRSPERVDRLVLVDSYGLGTDIPRGRLGYLLVRAPLVDDLTYALLRRSRRMIRWSLYNLVHDRSAVDDALVEDAYRLVNRTGAGRAFRSFQRSEVGWGGLRTSYVNRLREVSVPTLIVHGASDEAVPVAWAYRAHRLIPGSQLGVIPRCGHWPPRERPGEFNRIVGEFLTR
jgi:pimeloyl-ACP methyl ester carboxylesterase